MDDMPQNLKTWIERYPEGLYALGATLKPLRAIMSRTMQAQGLDYAGAVNYLINEHFALCFEDYVETYEPERGTTALDFCRIRFCYKVRSANEYEMRVSNAREARGKGTDSRDVQTIVGVERHSALEQTDCQLSNAIAWEARKAELQALSNAVDSLRALDSMAAYIVWQHSALGVSYDMLGQRCGMSHTRVKAIFRGAMAHLRRIAGAAD